MYRHLVLVRHGQSAMNAAQDKHQGQGPVETRFCGQFDTPLTELGREQATLAGIALGQRGDLRISFAVSSALPRARETLDLILPHLPSTVIRCDSSPQLNERSLGEFEGLTVAEVLERWPQYLTNDRLNRFRDDFVQKAPRGENLTEVTNRAWDHIEQLRSASDGDLLVVSHSMTIRCIVGQALGSNPSTWLETSVKNSKPIVLRGGTHETAWAGRMERLE